MEMRRIMFNLYFGNVPSILSTIHGVFYFSCTFMPMTGMFSKTSSGGDGLGGRLALVAWCVYFLPIGVLAYRHFSGQQRES